MRPFELIQSRYGWTDKVVHELRFSRFEQLASLLSEIRQEEAKEKIILATFVGWQMGAGGGKTFDEYLKDMVREEHIKQVEPQKNQDEVLSRMGIKGRKL